MCRRIEWRVAPGWRGSNLADGLALAGPSVRLAIRNLARIAEQRRLALGDAGQTTSSSPRWGRGQIGPIQKKRLKYP